MSQVASKNSIKAEIHVGSESSPKRTHLEHGLAAIVGFPPVLPFPSFLVVYSLHFSRSPSSALLPLFGGGFPY